MIYMYTQIDRYSQLNINIPACSTNEVVGTIGFLRQRPQCQWRQGGLHLPVRYVLRLSRPVGPSRSQFSFLHILHRCLQIAFPITVINGLLVITCHYSLVQAEKMGQGEVEDAGFHITFRSEGMHGACPGRYVWWVWKEELLRGSCKSIANVWFAVRFVWS